MSKLRVLWLPIIAFWASPEALAQTSDLEGGTRVRVQALDAGQAMSSGQVGSVRLTGYLDRLSGRGISLGIAVRTGP